MPNFIIQDSDWFIVERDGVPYRVLARDLAYHTGKIRLFSADETPGTFLDKVTFDADDFEFNIQSEGAVTDYKLTISTKNKSFFMAGSGRFYCYSNNRWVTNSDDSYGANYQQMNENCGTGAEPIIEWEHMGTVLPKGTIMRKLNFACRTNSTQVTDVEFRVVVKTPNPITRWESGVDNDSEDIIHEMFSGFFVLPTMSGNMADLRKHVMDLGDYALPDDAMISIYLRPVGTISATRYLTSTWSWELATP